MTSLALYRAIAALSINMGGVAPRVYGVATSQKVIPAANLPARTITIASGNDSSESRPTTTGRNPSMQITHTVRDLLLWKPASFGEALVQDDEALLTYGDDYVLLFKANRSLAAGITLQTIRTSPGIFAFGEPQSAVSYLGCEVVLTVSELLQG